MDPKQLALQFKDALNATGAFVVQPDGQVKMAANRGGGFAPPWVWAGAIPPASGNDAQSQALRVKLSTPASDPSSPWHAMYQDGGPFTDRSMWDSSKGTYEGGTDWGTLLGTAAVGSLFAAPALAAAFGGGGGATSIPAAFGNTAVDTVSSAAPSLAGTVAGGTGTWAADGSWIPDAAAGGAAGSASSTPSWLVPALKAGVPTALSLATRPTSASGTAGLPPDMQDMIGKLLNLSMQRQQETAPVHQAAMALAQRLAPTGTSFPRMDQAVQQTTGPGPMNAPMNPQVAAAVAKLMGGR